MIKMATMPCKTKTFRNLLLCNQKSCDLETLYVSSTKFINDGPGLTLAYFMARSNLVNIAYYAYIRPRCQVSFYRTIGPLVIVSK